MKLNVQELANEYGSYSLLTAYLLWSVWTMLLKEFGRNIVMKITKIVNDVEIELTLSEREIEVEKFVGRSMLN